MFSAIWSFMQGAIIRQLKSIEFNYSTVSCTVRYVELPYIYIYTYIIYRPELGTLNKRNELASACRHKAPFLLKNFKT